MNTTNEDALFDDYLADRLSGDDVKRLKQVLARDRSARARFVEVLQEWELLAESARQITGNTCPVIDDSANSDVAKRRRPPSRVAASHASSRRAWRLLVRVSALAAMLLVAVWFIRPATEVDPLSVVSNTIGDVHLVRGNDRVLVKAGTQLQLGDQVQVGADAQASIEYADKTRVQLDQRTRIQLAAATSSTAGQGKRVVLTTGRITAHVSKQPVGQSMIFITPNAEAVVLGTVLTLEFTATAQATRLDVAEGLVGFTDTTNRTMAEVPAGHFATVAANTQAIARPLVAAVLKTRTNYRAGIRATYFADTELKEQIFSRIEPGIHTDIGLDTVPVDQRRTNFSVRWSGYLQPLFSEKYLLTLHCDAGVRLYLDDRVVIDAWGAERMTYHQASVMLDASKRHPLRVEYKQPKSGMKIKLEWVSANQQPEIIPIERWSTDQ